jgi:hypothetical protein
VKTHPQFIPQDVTELLQALGARQKGLLLNTGDEDSFLLGRDAMPLDKQFQIFQRIAVYLPILATTKSMTHYSPQELNLQ